MNKTKQNKLNTSLNYMEENLEILDAIYNPDAINVYGVSPVFDPANEQLFITLSKQDSLEKIELMVDEERRMVYGVVLIPEQLIKRQNPETRQLFFLRFKESVVRNFSRDFFLQKNNSNAWENHDKSKPIDGFTYVENWIVEDPTNDKINTLGLATQDIVTGTWVLGAYVSDDLIWEKCKNGEFNGFSIDSLLDLRKAIDMSQMTKNNNNNKIKKETMSLLKKTINLFIQEQKLASAEVDGFGLLTADAFEIDNIVLDENLAPLMNATFTLDGFDYQTDETGIIISKVATTAQSTNLGDITLPEGVVSSTSYSVGDLLTLDNGDGNGAQPYANADIQVEGKQVKTDADGIITSAEPVQTDATSGTTVQMESESLWKYEAEDGTECFAEWLGLGNNVYDVNQAACISMSFNYEGCIYTTDDKGEIITIAKDSTSPYWTVDMKSLKEIELASLETTKQNEKLQKQLDVVLQKNIELNSKLEELSKAPAVGRVKANMSAQVDLAKMTPLQLHRYYKSLDNQ